MSRLLISNVRFWGEPTSHPLHHVAIEDGTILSVGEKPPAGFEADEIWTGNGELCLPGLVELCGFLREPGYEHKGTLRSELGAAAKGGVTTVCAPPLTQPVNDTAAVTRLIQERARNIGLSRVLPIGAMTRGLAGEQLTEMAALRDAGCIAVSNLRAPFASHRVMERCLEYAASQDMRVFVAPWDTALADGGCVHEGAVASRLGLAGIPPTAEILAVSQWLMLAESSGVRLHLTALSCARSVEMVAQARARGLLVSADVALANLLYTDACIEDFDSRFHVLPPLRSEADRQALLEGVRSGVIEAISSRHEPHEQAAIQAPFAETEPGMSQFEVWLSLLWILSRSENIDFGQLVHASSQGAARVAGLGDVGLEPGKQADLVVFDPHGSNHIDPASWLSAGRNSPFLGETLQGRVTVTVVGGRIVYDHEKGLRCGATGVSNNNIEKAGD